MSSHYLIPEKPFQTYYDHHFKADESNIKHLEDQFLIKCSRGLHQLIYRFTESPNFGKMSERLRQKGFEILFRKNRENNPAEFRKAFLEACESGCAEMVHHFTHFRQFDTLAEGALSEGLKLAVLGFNQSGASQKERFSRVIEEITCSPRCDDLSDEELRSVSPVSPLARERCIVITTTRETLKQLALILKQASPSP